MGRAHARMLGWLAGLCAAGLLACGAPKGLSRAEVEGLPAGNASGSDFSGEYDVDVYITNCQGNCPVINAGIFTITTCDIGTREEVHVSLEQTDGKLVILNDAAYLVSRLEGGIDADGSFTAGGYGTQAGGAVQISVRVDGQVNPDGSLTATAQAYGEGSYNDQSIACTGSYMVESR